MKSLLLKRIRSVLVIKKKWFLMIRIQIWFVICKKVIFDDKNSNMFCYMFYKE